MTGGSGHDLFVHTSDQTATISDLGKGSDNFTVNALTTTGVLTATVAANYTAGTTTQNQGTLGKAVLTGSGFDVNMGAVTSGTTGFVINGNTTAATLQGSGLADSITGGAAADSLVGNAGNDLLVGGAQNDTIVAGAGNDTIEVNATATQFAGDSINGGTGTDVINMANGVDTLTAEFDMDNITDVLSIKTTGAGAAGKDTTITFSIVTETTTQTVNVNATSLTDGAGDLVIVNNSAIASTTFNVTGGAEGDTIAGGIGNDTINPGVGADKITGGAGNDSITLTEGIDEVDTLVTAATAVLEGEDSIIDFVQATSKDVYNPNAFLDAIAMNAAITSDALITADSDVNLIVDIDGNQDITTATGLNTALAVGGEYAQVNMGNSAKAIFVTAASAATGVAQHVFFGTSDGSGDITAVKVGVFTGTAMDINTWHSDNFNI
jgi:Ca2+-binding RTX toxin-like protein